MIRRGRTVGIGMLVAALLAGCVSIPTASGVQSAQIDTDPDDVSSVVLPDRPHPGQTMEEILQGFIRAGRGPQNSYSIAQEYLVPGTVWSGTERVLITTSSTTQPIPVDEDTMILDVVVVAEVDQQGRYVALPLPVTQTLTYNFTTVDGEIRIVDPPPGTVLSRNAFTAAFDEYSLYFFDPSFRFLVPELHWFPTSRVADRIVSELVQGQAAWLQSGVLQSAFPPGTTATAVLDAPGVDVTLSAGVRAESAITQRRMIQQLRASLASIGASVSAGQIEVTADGLALAPAPEDVVPETTFAVGPPIGGWEGVFGELSAGPVSPLAGIGTAVDVLQPVAATLSRDRSSVVVLGAEGVSLVDRSGSRLIDARSGLVAPTIDPFGYVWSVPQDDPRGLQVTGPDGIPHALPIAADGRVVSIELSRDGARLLVALDLGDRSRLFAVGVLRDADSLPVALHTPYELYPMGRIVDVAWVDGLRVAVATDGEAGTSVQVLPLGGPRRGIGNVDAGIALVGGASEAGLRVLTATGDVFRPTSVGGWAPTGLVASFLGTQQ